MRSITRNKDHNVSNITIELPREATTWLVEFVTVELESRTETLCSRSSWARTNPANGVCEARAIEHLAQLLSALYSGCAEAEFNPSSRVA